MKISDYHPILKVKDIQNILRIGQRQTYALVKSSEFQKIRLGNTNLYSKELFINWLTGKEE